MNCRRVNHLVSAYMDGELGGTEQLLVRQHLQDCACCQAEYDDLLRTKRMLCNLSTVAPKHELEEMIIARLACEPVSQSGFSRLSWMFQSILQRPVGRMTIAAAGLATAVIVFVPRAQDPSTLGTVGMQDFARTNGNSSATIAPASMEGPVRDYLFAHDAYENAHLNSRPANVQPASRLTFRPSGQ